MKKVSRTHVDGVLVTTTLEPQKPTSWINRYKDGIDIFFKTIGALAIFTPLILFYEQYRNEIIKKKNADLSQAYINIAFDLEAAKNNDPGIDKYTSASENLLYKYPAQIAVFKFDSITSRYDSIVQSFKMYSAVKWSVNQLKSIYYPLEDLYSYSQREIIFNRTISSPVKLNSIKANSKLLHPDSSVVVDKNDVISYSIRFNGISKSELLTKIDSFINFSNKLRRHETSPAYQFASRYFSKVDALMFQSDPELSKLFVYLDSADTYGTNIVETLPNLRKYITKSKKKALSKHIPLNGPAFSNEHNFGRMLDYLTTALNLLEIRLDKSRDIFSKEILTKINN